MRILTSFFTIGFVLLLTLNHSFPHPFITDAAITFGTTAYHFIMRLAVGGIVNGIYKNQFDYSTPWFQTKPCERAIYEKWNVKAWKEKLPSYDPSLFSLKEHSFHEIAQAMCQAEIVHELIIVLSFVPLLFSIWLGTFPVFLITSVAAAVFDSLFVIVQRYNRERIVRLAKRTKSKK